MPASSRNKDVAAEFETDPKQRQLLLKNLQPGTEEELAWTVLPPKHRTDFASLSCQLNQATEILSQAFKSLRHDVTRCCQALQPTAGGSDRTKSCRTAVLLLQPTKGLTTDGARSSDVVVCACAFAVLQYAPTKETALLALFMSTAHEYRGRGLEALLVSQLKVLAAAKGCKVMFSNVINTPGATQQFWGQSGFSDARSLPAPEGMSAAGYHELQRHARETWNWDTLLWACSDLKACVGDCLDQIKALWNNPSALVQSPGPLSADARKARSTPASGAAASKRLGSTTPTIMQRQATLPQGARLLTPEQLQQRMQQAQQQMAAATLPHADSITSSGTAMSGQNEHAVEPAVGLHGSVEVAARADSSKEGHEHSAKRARTAQARDVSDKHAAGDVCSVAVVGLQHQPQSAAAQAPLHVQRLHKHIQVQQRSKQSLSLLLQALNGSTLKGAQVKRPSSASKEHKL